MTCNLFQYRYLLTILLLAPPVDHATRATPHSKCVPIAMKSHLLLLLALGATIAVAIDNNGPTSQLISEKLRPAVPAGLDLRKHELQERTYESRLNHFDPRSSETVQFVSVITSNTSYLFVCLMSHDPICRNTSKTSTTTKRAVPSIFSSAMAAITQRNSCKSD